MSKAQEVAEREPCICFWTGGFVRYAAVFMLGVLVTLMFLGFAVRNVVNTPLKCPECPRCLPTVRHLTP